jgi:hypothetical protein
MQLSQWGRMLLIGGTATAAASAAPAVLLAVLPPAFGSGFFGLVAIMLTLSVTPLGVVAASVGALLLLLAWARRRGRP